MRTSQEVSTLTVGHWRNGGRGTAAAVRVFESTPAPTVAPSTRLNIVIIRKRRFIMFSFLLDLASPLLCRSPLVLMGERFKGARREARQTPWASFRVVLPS